MSLRHKGVSRQPAGKGAWQRRAKREDVEREARALKEGAQIVALGEKDQNHQRVAKVGGAARDREEEESVPVLRADRGPRADGAVHSEHAEWNRREGLDVHVREACEADEQDG